MDGILNGDAIKSMVDDEVAVTATELLAKGLNRVGCGDAPHAECYSATPMYSLHAPPHFADVAV